MSALDDRDISSAEQWQSAIKFMTSAVQKEIRSTIKQLDKLVGPKSNRWLRWRSQSEVEAKRQAIAEDLTKFLNAESVSRYICRICCLVRYDRCVFILHQLLVSVKLCHFINFIAEQVRMIQEKLDAYKEALSSQQNSL